MKNNTFISSSAITAAVLAICGPIQAQPVTPGAKTTSPLLASTCLEKLASGISQERCMPQATKKSSLKKTSGQRSNVTQITKPVIFPGSGTVAPVAKVNK
jgi:hypothetical protein